MLILQRKRDESILINGNIEVTIIEIGAEKVKLAITAPKEVSILRSELVKAANENQKANASITPESISMLHELLK